MFVHWMDPNIWPNGHWLKGPEELAKGKTYKSM